MKELALESGSRKLSQSRYISSLFEVNLDYSYSASKKINKNKYINIEKHKLRRAGPSYSCGFLGSFTFHNGTRQQEALTGC